MESHILFYVTLSDDLWANSASYWDARGNGTLHAKETLKIVTAVQVGIANGDKSAWLNLRERIITEGVVFEM